MLYKELYEDPFFNNFKNNEVKEKIANNTLKDENVIDIENIVLLSGLKLEATFGGPSGSLDCKSNTIYYNVLEPEYRQRFTIAHELGHYLLGHKGIQLRSKDLTLYDDAEKKNNEMQADSFAAECLMPKKLIIRILKKVLKERSLNHQAEFSEYELEQILFDIGKRIQGSKSAVRNRLENLGILRLSHGEK